MITPGKVRKEAFTPDRNTEEQENYELFQFDKTGNISVRYLRESYNAAKARASELNTNAGLSGNLRSHCQQTIRVYSALATLLYSTISISKADDLERFVRKRSLQVPNSLFDLDEWKPVLQIARNVRMGESGKYMDELGAFKSFMKLRLERILTGSRMVINEYKKMRTETSKELEALKSHMEDFRYKVIPYLQQKISHLQDENYKLVRNNKVLTDANAAKDVEIKELTRTKSTQEKEHLAHVERIKKESFEAIAFAKSKIETQQSAHRSEMNSMTRQHESKLEEMRKSFDAQILHSSVTNQEVIDRLTKEREWLQKTHATVLSNAEKIQQQFKSQCDSEVERLEKRYAEAMANANSRLASESSNTQQLLQSTSATYEAKISSANAAREYETSMLQVKLDAMEKDLKETQDKLEKSQKHAEELAVKVYSGEAEMIAKRSEMDNLNDNLANQKLMYETLKDNNNAELDRLRKQLEGLLNDKSDMSVAIGTLTAERDEIRESKDTWTTAMNKLEYKEQTLRKEHEEQTRIVGEMESEKCRLMSYYDEKCLESTAQKKEIASLKNAIEAARKKQLLKEDEHYQLLNDLEADKSRLMGYYDEKCLQSDGYKKQIKKLEEAIVRLRKEYKEKELDTMRLMNDIEADKSRLMGYYDEKCLQIGTYKKQLATFEKEIARMNSERSIDGDNNALSQELALFKQQMKQQEMTPVKSVNVRKPVLLIYLCDL
jgi:myosin protein heavy chain